jgi:hypothetical protein
MLSSGSCDARAEYRERNLNDESLRDWAARGLRRLGTPDARKALIDAGLEPDSP